MGYKSKADFYGSREWKNCRAAYTSYRKGLCERCLQRGIYTASDIVHHKKYITPQNLNDPSITLSWDNLMLVCRDCHAKIHSRDKRYRIDEYGRCIITELERGKNDPGCDD